MRELQITGKERFFGENELIVSKTDLKGRMTYCNKVFLDIAGYEEKECLGKPHSMIRHPYMPRCIFKLLWDYIENGEEIFAYVVNRAANGDHYWVLAHVTPSVDMDGNVMGYHSNRRVPNRDVLENVIQPLYKDLCAKEAEFNNAKEGLAASVSMFDAMMKDKGIEYNHYISSLN